MKTILVTGANGQLGQCIQKIADKHTNFEFAFKGSKELDITDAEQIKTVFNSKKFDFCINCAAYTNIEQAEKTPEVAFKINSEGVKNLANACKEKSIVLIHISTDYVFDGEKHEPYAIDDTPNPINEYGKSKLQGELIIKETLDNYIIVRTSWLYSEFGKNFYKTILRKAKEKAILSVTDQQVGCPTNANNLAKLILQLIRNKSLDFGIYHFTDGEAMTWYDFAKKILIDNNLRHKTNLERDRNYRTFAARPRNSRLN